MECLACSTKDTNNDYDDDDDSSNCNDIDDKDDDDVGDDDVDDDVDDDGDDDDYNDDYNKGLKSPPLAVINLQNKHSQNSFTGGLHVRTVRTAPTVSSLPPSARGRRRLCRLLSSFCSLTQERVAVPRCPHHHLLPSVSHLSATIR